MNDLLPEWILLARQSPLEDFAREFQGRETRLAPAYLLTGLAIVGGVLVAVWLLSRILERFDGRRPVDSPTMLFLSLCRAHKLRWSESWLLLRVTQEQKLRDPAQLFLEPERLAPANLPAALRPRSEQLQELRRRLFAGLPEADLQGAPSADHATADVERAAAEDS